MNLFWLVFIGSGVFIAGINGEMETITAGLFQGITRSVTISISLLGPIAFWMGMMKIAGKAGIVDSISRLLKPILRVLFPRIPDGHSALGLISLNLSANLLGMGNTATPLGIRAMQSLQELNTDKSTASPAMCTLLALNTSSLTLIPTTMISLRSASGSLTPDIIILTTLFATGCSTLTAIILDRVFRYLVNTGP